METTLQQWRAAIGRWCVGGKVPDINLATETSGTTPWFYLLVLAALLVIGGVEQNPGPDSQQAEDRTEAPGNSWQGAALNTTQTTFNKLPGTGGLEGQLFEIKLLSLIYLRALNLGLPFSLATNVEEYQKFEDVVVQFDQGQGTCFFLQLKHRENVEKRKITRQTLLAETGDFSLRQYYKSYVNIDSYLRGKVGDNFNNYLFILFTNADVQDKLKNKQVPDIGSERFLMTCPDRVLQFNTTEHGFIYEQLKDLPQLAQFLGQLRVMYGQKAEGEVDGLVKEELLRTDVDTSDVDNLYKLYHNHVQEWWLGNHRLTEHLDEHSPLTRARHEMSTDRLGLRRAEISLMGVRFVQPALEELWGQIQGSSVAVVFSPGRSTTVTTAKVHQVLSARGRYLLVNSRDLAEHCDAILYNWEQGKFDVLVVECTDNVQLDLYKQIASALGEQRSLIIISKWMPVLDEIQYIRSIFKHCSEIHDCIKFGDFVQNTRELLLTKNVIFQGAGSCLSSLTGHSNKHIVDSETIILLLGGEHVQIGSGLAQSLQYYVDRTLTCQCFVGSDILKETGAVFAVLGTTRWELQELVPAGQSVCGASEWHSGCRYVAIDDLQSFLDLTLNIGSAHCLRRQGDRLVWVQSKGDLAIVRRHLSTDVAAEWHPSTALEGEGQVMLVTAEPGMGKSSLMTYLANQTKQLDPAMWVVRVNVNAHTKTLQDIKNKGFTEDKAVQMLAEAAGVEAQGLGWKLFTTTLVSGSNMVVLLDGVDEVSPLYFGQVVQVVDELSKTRIQKIWVTARPHMKKQLEDVFGRPAFCLKPFDVDDAKSFLVKFWGCKYTLYTEGVLKNVAENVMKLAERSFRWDEKKIMGVPLQTFLLAEVLEKYVANQDRAGEPTLPQYINLFLLYNKFVQKKWEIYINDKKMADNTNMNVILGNAIEYKNFIQEHKLAALVTILSEFEVFSLVNKEELSGIKNTRIERTGIVTDVVDGRPQFVHRTFAEYFTAMWFAEHLQECRKFLSEHLMTDKFQVVRRVLDYILTEGCPLHLAAMNGEAVQCDQVDVLDKGGRTALHLAVMYQHPDVARVLLHEGCDVNVVDKVLGWTVLELARKTDNWDFIAELLSARPDVRDDVVQEINIKSVRVYSDCLYATVRRGLVPLMNYLFVDKGLNIKFWSSELVRQAVECGQSEVVQWLFNYMSDSCSQTDGTKSSNSLDATYEDGRTLLHIAAEHGQEEVVRELLAANCDTNIADKYGWTALFIASLRGHVQVANMIHNTTMLDIPALLAASGCDFNSAGDNGRTPLHLATQHGNVDALQFLVSAGCDTNVADKDGRTPLHVASEHGSVDVVRTLISAGCDINPTDKLSCTPLHLASRHGRVKTVQFLISAGCDSNITDLKGHTPLSAASHYGHKNVAQLLSGDEQR